MKRQVMLALLLAFALPPLLAYLAFSQGWLQGGISNHGNLIAQGVQLEQGPRGQWQILVVPAGPCETACQNATYIARQTRQALGREGDRVTLALAWQTDAQPNFAVEADWQVWTLTDQSTNQLLREADTSQLYLVDPAGNVVLAYPAEADRNAMIATGRGMLKDLKRLLKYSRLG